MQLRDKAVLVYDEVQTDGAKGLQLFRSMNMREQRKETYTGRLTPGAKKRLAKAVTLMVQGTRRRWIFNPVSGRHHVHHLSFMTLTISDPTRLLDGKTAHKWLLAPFLAWLRKTKEVNTYIWKAELQKNGQIHYHVTLPNFIHYKDVRDKWNDLQRKAGLLDRYFAEHGHYDANSTDMHKVYKVRDMAAYMVKELTKSIQNAASLGGKVWDCSANLSEAKYYTSYMKQSHHDFLELAVEEKLASKFEGERFSIYRFKESPEEYLLTKSELAHYRSWLEVISSSMHYNDPPDPTEKRKTASKSPAA